MVLKGCNIDDFLKILQTPTLTQRLQNFASNAVSHHLGLEAKPEYRIEAGSPRMRKECPDHLATCSGISVIR